MSFFDEISTSIGYEEKSGFTQHPVGKFDATITRVDPKFVNGRPVWELFLRTEYGTANHNRWGFSTEDERLCKSGTQEGLDLQKKVVDSIAKAKRLFVDLGVFTAEEAKPITWSTLVTMWDLLVGRACQLVVQPDSRKPGHIVTFINKHPSNYPAANPRAGRPLNPVQDFLSDEKDERRVPVLDNEKSAVNIPYKGVPTTDDIPF